MMGEGINVNFLGGSMGTVGGASSNDGLERVMLVVFNRVKFLKSSLHQNERPKIDLTP